MSSLSFLRGAAVALAALGMMIPNAPAMAAGPARAQVKTVDAKIFDVALSQGGTFKGRVVDHTGAAIEGAEVSIKQSNKEVAHSVTDKDGSFTASNLKTGVYQVSSGATEGVYRVWSEKTAPPSAKEQSLLVLGENGARGNFGVMGDEGLILLAVTAVGAVAIVALVLAINNKNEKTVYVPVSP
eukprot:TRINITY_DN836_c3_g2_i5.p1 TRINITY_DN836_c3_g2~~TRINITY_DN836_c3_g2_i5.p1  ORF type:complete len:184 (-),score=54.33 TRINITY_DN836_c3_g2_i5:308-859(-)